jgi:hypothetical protein
MPTSLEPSALKGGDLAVYRTVAGLGLNARLLPLIMTPSHEPPYEWTDDEDEYEDEADDDYDDENAAAGGDTSEADATDGGAADGDTEDGDEADEADEEEDNDEEDESDTPSPPGSPTGDTFLQQIMMGEISYPGW